MEFRYGDEPRLRDVTLRLCAGERCLLTGDNGSGKVRGSALPPAVQSTLLRVLAGRHLPTGGDLRVLGTSDSFSPILNEQCSLVESSWGQRTVPFGGYGVSLLSDVAVSDLMREAQAQFPDRRAALLRVLRVDPGWRVHRVSDGQRRRVQLFLGLLRPFRLLLLDEATSDLDLLTRADLLRYLAERESGALIVYATHILEGTEDWATRLLFLERGAVLRDLVRPLPPLRATLEAWIRAGRESGDGCCGDEGGAGEARSLRGYEPGRSSLLGF